MIYDCFTFSNELDLLELRLHFLFDVVDRFVIVESPATLSGNKKPLHYLENKERFKKYTDKIIHVVCPPLEFGSAWDYEYYQRNYIKTGLTSCNDDDLILISDVDEIINLPDILASNIINEPVLIELPLSYYFYNLKNNITFAVNLLAKYKDIKHLHVGDRFKYKDFAFNILPLAGQKNGWHFSYMFGYNTHLYQLKIQSFSHQEYNTPYYLNPKRIKRCIILGLDLFERDIEKFYQVELKSEFTQALLTSLRALKMANKYKLSLKKLFLFYIDPAFTAYMLRRKLITVPLLIKIRNLVRFT